jgi:Spy/CpxP family protein refolding chaperone
MKSKWFMPIGAAVVVAGLAFAYAQTAPHPGQHRSANRQEWTQHRFDRMSAFLNLTDAQKAQAKTVLEGAHQNTMPFAAQLKQNRQALAQAVKTDNTADIERLSAEQGRLMGKTVAIRTEAFAKVYQTLTPEQRAKADQMAAHFGTMRHERPNRSQS